MPATSNLGSVAADADRRRVAILARRDAHGLTTRELAFRMGIDPSLAFRILRGRTNPGPKFITAYARVFGVDALADLLPHEAAA